VSVADKLHNARTILTDYREIGEALWSRFNAGKEGTLWYYQEIIQVYRKISHCPQRMVDELEKVVAELLCLSNREKSNCCLNP